MEITNEFEQTVKSEYFKNLLTNKIGGKIVLDFAEAMLQAELHKIFYVGFSLFDIIIAKCPYPYSYPYIGFQFSSLLLQINAKHIMERVLLEEVDKELDITNIDVSIVLDEYTTQNTIYQPIFDKRIEKLIHDVFNY